MLDPRALLTFHRVCEAGSISGAARMLNISQPSVSSAMAAMEARLGLRLFDRSRSGIALTPEGEALRLRAEMLFHLLGDAEQDVRDAARGMAGPLRVGGTPGALVSLLPPALRALEARGVHASVSVFERADGELNTMLRSGEIEVAFVTTEIGEVPDDLMELTVSRDLFRLIVGRANDDLPNRISLARAGSLSWVLPEAQGAFRRQVDALFVSCGVATPANVIRCDSLLTTKAIVRAGVQVTILPAEVASAELSIGVLRAIEIEESGLARCVGVRTCRDRLLSFAARRLLAELAARDGGHAG